MSTDDEEDEKDSTEVVDSDQVEASGEGPAPAREESVEVRSEEARRKLRDQMQAEIDAFLKRGGRIEMLEASANAQGTSFTAGVNDLSQ